MSTLDLGSMMLASLEEIEAEITIVVEAGELESANVEIVDAADAAERADGEADDLVEVAQGLESLLNLATASLESGGLTGPSAAMLGVSVESLQARTSLTFATTPALEAYGGTASRYDTTVISIEGIKENLKAVWEHIKAAFAKAWEMVIQFIGTVFKNVSTLRNRAKALTKAVDGTKGKATGTIAIPASKLAFEGKTDIAAILKGLLKTEAVLESALSTGVEAGAALYESIVTSLKGGEAFSADDVYSKYKIVGGDISGGYTVSATLQISTAKTIGTADSDVPTLGQIKSLGLRAIEIADTLDRKEKGITALGAKAKAAQSAIDAYINGQINDIAKTDAKFKDKMVEAAGITNTGVDGKLAIKAFRGNVAGKITHISNVAYQAASAAVALGEASLKQYGADAVKEADAA